MITNQRDFFDVGVESLILDRPTNGKHQMIHLQDYLKAKKQ